MGTGRHPEEGRERQDEEEEGGQVLLSPSARPGPALLASPESNRLEVLYVRPLYGNRIRRDRRNKASASLTKAPPLSKLGALST